MTEDYLHYVWKFRLFNSPLLSTEAGEEIVILYPGVHNSNGGPDFLNARIKIGKHIWAGHVEIHIKSGDWHRHDHTNDLHYKNVILHVVYENDRDIFLHRKGDLAVLNLSRYLIAGQWQNYLNWMTCKLQIPCQKRIHLTDSLTWTSWKDRLLMERLESKTEKIMAIYQRTNSNWSETFYRAVARNFGFKVNADAMEMLAESMPQIILARHKSDPFQIEALLFGQSGLLNEQGHRDYGLELFREYKFLAVKYGLKPMSPASWTFFRMRPSNFPTIRIAQFARLISESEHLFSKVIELEDIVQLKQLFRVNAREYWKNHFRFDKMNPQLSIEKEEDNKEKKYRRLRSGAPGESSIENIMINTIAPFLFAYGKSVGEEGYIQRGIALIESCAAEENHILTKWKTMGIEIQTAADAQSLIQLYNEYCSQKKCLHCQIGLKLLRD